MILQKAQSSPGGEARPHRKSKRKELEYRLPCKMFGNERKSIGGFRKLLGLELGMCELSRLGAGGGGTVRTMYVIISHHHHQHQNTTELHQGGHNSASGEKNRASPEERTEKAAARDN